MICIGWLDIKHCTGLLCSDCVCIYGRVVFSVAASDRWTKPNKDFLALRCVKKLKQSWSDKQHWLFHGFKSIHKPKIEVRLSKMFFCVCTKSDTNNESIRPQPLVGKALLPRYSCSISLLTIESKPSKKSVASDMRCICSLKHKILHEMSLD